jgi:hypothetical protein
MDSDFNVGPRRRTTFDSSNEPVRANRYEDVDVLAIAADDPFWQNGGPKFSPPEDTSGNNLPPQNERQSGDEPGEKKPWYKRLRDRLAKLSRKQWIIIIAIILVITAGSAVALAAVLGKDKAEPKKSGTSNSSAAPVPPPSPTSPLTGIDVKAEDTKRPVIGVMIENSTFARPQSGLQEAGVVYEAIAEYGITRFLALYQEASPANIGPVRSARPYFVDWAHSYDAGYAHVGGSPDALAKIKTDGVRDLDQFANGGSYRRISQREAPHNVYTTGEQLRTLTASKGYTSSSFTGLTRKKEAKAAKPTATAVDIAISGPTYNVHYDYDAATNSYLRVMAGEAHKDADSGKQIVPKVVIGLATQYGLMADGYHSTYTTTGTGAVKIFQDGTVTEGTWKRDTATSQYVFTDSAGKVIALDPGQVWFTVVGDPAAITYTAPAAATAQ